MCNSLWEKWRFQKGPQCMYLQTNFGHGNMWPVNVLAKADTQPVHTHCLLVVLCAEISRVPAHGELTDQQWHIGNHLWKERVSQWWQAEITHTHSCLPEFHKLMRGTEGKGEWLYNRWDIRTDTTGQNGGNEHIEDTYWKVLPCAPGVQWENV